MEEIEINSWLTLDAIKNEAEIIETVGDLQSGHCQSVFCVIEDDHMELCYMDTESNFLRTYDDKDEFGLALETRKEDVGESAFDENVVFDKDFDDSSDDEDEDFSDSDDDF
ncbi:MAG: hypothetical protein KKD59_10775 [Acidobacteria bacterium]|nr:hypothetical protein [Acidobacteriota bacterium]